jgi:hypothetical protein
MYATISTITVYQATAGRGQDSSFIGSIITVPSVAREQLDLVAIRIADHRDHSTARAHRRWFFEDFYTRGSERGDAACDVAHTDADMPGVLRVLDRETIALVPKLDLHAAGAGCEIVRHTEEYQRATFGLEHDASQFA